MPSSERALADRVLSLPMGPDLGEADQDRVVAETLSAIASVPAILTN